MARDGLKIQWREKKDCFCADNPESAGGKKTSFHGKEQNQKKGKRGWDHGECRKRKKKP